MGDNPWGCIFFVFALCAGIAWISFLIWAIYAITM